MTRPPFHHAFPVGSLAETRAFYGVLLGCREGRSAEGWVDFELHGHQLSAHVVPGAGIRDTRPVDGDAVPIPHFGLVLPWAEWEALADRLRAADHPFRIGPRVRFEGEPGEQGTFFVDDPSGNALEFKAFRDPGRLFAAGAG